ncbi:NADH dehydrogenase [ubiquinone] 1 alpha subcomplex assembly factor 8 [Merluccius polli]|uniref:NADH dehydrogenase [ubiquinone] 1 alpha subcomplex assembly factor 8 n=1 Tax=Merluccius polli TaxID=89951 RepID=A0AA47MZW8_MERPO|nr:NADH dehydrogenase [ubiquinone] 1 alpha subcomplex assembly factor 8 [Merluccius polli]
MSGTGVWTRSRETFRRFPERFAQCPAEVRDQVLPDNTASAYGKCVVATTTNKQELKKDLCVKEFEALKACFLKAVGGDAKTNTM